MFHYIRENNCKYPIHYFEQNKFFNTIKKLSKKYRFHSLEDIINDKANEGIHLSFDDGLLEHAEWVGPILEDMNISGSFFPCTDSMVNRKTLKVHTIQFVVNYLDRKGILSNSYKEALSELDLSFVSNININNKWDKYYVNIIKSDLQYRYPEEIRECILSRLLDLVNKDLYNNFIETLYFNQSQAEELVKMGHTLGNHGHSHIVYSHSSSIEIKNDFTTSQKYGSYLFNTDIFCYPYGRTSDLVKNELNDLGCSVALGTQSKYFDSKCDLMDIPRIDCNDIDKYL